MLLKEKLLKDGNFLFKHRGTLPIIAILGSIAVYLYDLQSGDYTPVITHKWICFSIGLIGLLIRSHVVGFSSDSTSGRNTEQQVADSINTTGLYSLVRNPLYLGNFLMYLSLALWTQNLWLVVVFTLVFYLYYERIIYAEEQYLTSKFGEPYVNWASLVPAFIPKITGYSKASNPFNIWKVIRQEKNGFFALTLLFAVFEWIELWWTNNTINLLENPWTILAIVGGITYLVVKIFKKKLNSM